MITEPWMGTYGMQLYQGKQVNGDKRIEDQLTALFLYCCIPVNIYHKLCSLKQLNLLSNSFHGSIPWVRLVRFAAQDLTRLKSRCSLELQTHLKLVVSFQDHTLLVEFSSLQCKTEGRIFLLVTSRKGPFLSS